MDEVDGIDHDPDMMLAPPQAHEDEIARFERIARDRHAAPLLLARGTGKIQTDLPAGVRDESAAIEAAGRTAAATIRFTQHVHGRRHEPAQRLGGVRGFGGAIDPGDSGSAGTRRARDRCAWRRSAGCSRPGNAAAVGSCGAARGNGSQAPVRASREP